MLIFIDGSVNPQLKIGFGAYLYLNENEIENISKNSIIKNIKLKKFLSTSSTKLEAQILLWVLKEIKENFNHSIIKNELIIYSDSQNLIRLPERRIKLESNNFKSVKSNKVIKNAELYQEIYRLLDKLNYKFVKLAGHKKKKEKSDIDNIFTMVDRASRKALRQYIKTEYKS